MRVKFSDLKRCGLESLIAIVFAEGARVAKPSNRKMTPKMVKTNRTIVGIRTEIRRRIHRAKVAGKGCCEPVENCGVFT